MLCKCARYTHASLKLEKKFKTKFPLQRFLFPLDLPRLAERTVHLGDRLLGGAVRDLTRPGTFLQLNVTVDGPTFLLPEAADSRELFVLYPG